MTMSDSISAASTALCFNKKNEKEFRLLMRTVIQDNLSSEQLKTLHWHLMLPLKLLEDPSPSLAILRCLEERNIIKEWRLNPTNLLEILKEDLHRDDLASKVEDFSEERQSFTPPQVHLIQQETTPSQALDAESGTTTASADLTGSTVVVRPRRLRTGSIKMKTSDLEPVQEEDCKTRVKSQEVEGESSTSQTELDVNGARPKESSDGDWGEFLSSQKVREDYGNKTIDGLTGDFRGFLAKKSSSSNHDSIVRTISNASSGYYSERSSDARLSQMSFLESGDVRNSFSSKLNDVEESQMTTSYTPVVHPNAANMVAQAPLQPPRPASPTPAKKNSVSSMDREGQPTPESPFSYNSLPIEFRRRSSSLPSNAKAIRGHIHIKLRKGSTTSSSTSLASEDSEMTLGSCYSSQQSILSGDQSSSDSCTDAGSIRGSQENIKTNSLKRVPTMSSIRISSQIQLPILKVLSKKNQASYKSSPFPSSKDLQYEMRFIPSNFSKDSCALYIDVARDYLKRKAKQSSSATIKIPQMVVTVTVSSTEDKLTECLTEAHERVPAKTEIKNLQDFLKSKQNYLTVTSFPRLLKHSEIEKYRSTPQTQMVIQVAIECCT